MNSRSPRSVLRNLRRRLAPRGAALVLLCALPDGLSARDVPRTLLPPLPQSHPAARYAPLWTSPSPLFPAPEEPPSPPPPPPSATPPFPFTLTGIAQHLDRVLVFLMAEDRSIRTLVPGRPDGELEILDVFPGPEVTGLKAVARYRDQHYQLGFEFGHRPYAKSVPPPDPSPTNSSSSFSRNLPPLRRASGSVHLRQMRTRLLSPEDLESEDWWEGWFEDEKAPRPGTNDAYSSRNQTASPKFAKPKLPRF